MPASPFESLGPVRSASVLRPRFPIFFENRPFGLDHSSRKGIAMFTRLDALRFLMVVTLLGGLSTATPCRAQESCDDECYDSCDSCPRPSLCFSIARHLKLQSVYFCRKVTRPYRRIADVPPELCPQVSPSLPPNAYTNPAAYGVGAHNPAWSSGTATPWAYPPSGGQIRYTQSGEAGGYVSTIGSHP